MSFKFNFGGHKSEPSASADIAKTNHERKRAAGKEHFMEETHLVSTPYHCPLKIRDNSVDSLHKEHIGEDAVLLENAELGLMHLSGEEVEIDLKRDEKLFDSAESGASDLVPVSE